MSGEQATPAPAAPAISPERLALLEEIAKWAAGVRSAQRDYFRYRGSRELHFAKTCEGELDKRLRRLEDMDQPAQPVQPRLF